MKVKIEEQKLHAKVYKELPNIVTPLPVKKDVVKPGKIAPKKNAIPI